MSNEDRIKKWRARSAGAAYSVGAGAAEHSRNVAPEGSDEPGDLSDLVDADSVGLGQQHVMASSESLGEPTGSDRQDLIALTATGVIGEGSRFGSAAPVVAASSCVEIVEPAEAPGRQPDLESVGHEQAGATTAQDQVVFGQGKVPVDTQADLSLELEDPSSLLAAVLEPLDYTNRGATTTTRTVLSYVLRAVSRANASSVAGRRTLYESIQTQFARQAESNGLPGEESNFGSRRLRNTVNLVENDIRAGIDVHAEGYEPDTLRHDDERLAQAFAKRIKRRDERDAQRARRRASRDDVVLAVQLDRSEAADLTALRSRLALGRAQQHQCTGDVAQRPISAMLALILFQVRALHSESRFALVWMLFGPALLLTLISAMYFLSGTHSILGMDVASFSLTGATTWIMFRQIIFRSSSNYVAARGLLNLQGVTPLLTSLAQATIYLTIYLFVFALLITAGHHMELISLPADWTMCTLLVGAMGAAGACVGILFGAIATRWHYFLRLAPVLERALQLMSSVFFVTEQLPEYLRAFVLWSPFAHGMQLLRGAYFAGYRSSDASMTYFLTSLVFLAVLALVAERFARPHVQPM